MNIEELAIAGVKLVQPKVFGDGRGMFREFYNKDQFNQLVGQIDFIQDNHSRSQSKVIRGLHFQKDPSLTKLVGVIKGKVWDVVVDVRRDSPTFGQHAAVELSAENGCLLLIPPGIAHGFCVTSEDAADLFYKVDGAYNPKGEGGIAWDDPELAIDWPVKNPILSDRDRALPRFSKYQSDPWW